MTGAHEISVDALRERLDAFLRDLAARAPQIDMKDDLYWFLPVDAAFDVYRPPGAPTIGSVADAWDHVDKNADHIDYELVWFADILRAMARELTATSNPAPGDGRVFTISISSPPNRPSLVAELSIYADDHVDQPMEIFEASGRRILAIYPRHLEGNTPWEFDLTDVLEVLQSANARLTAHIGRPGERAEQDPPS